MDFSRYDVRKYPTVSVQEGYGEWVQTYEEGISPLNRILLPFMQEIYDFHPLPCPLWTSCFLTP